MFLKYIITVICAALNTQYMFFISKFKAHTVIVYSGPQTEPDITTQAAPLSSTHGSCGLLASVPHLSRAYGVPFKCPEPMGSKTGSGFSLRTHHISISSCVSRLKLLLLCECKTSELFYTTAQVWRADIYLQLLSIVKRNQQLDLKI